MSGLALKLAPKERVLINGVVVENGPRRAQLLIKTDNASVLRLRDALDKADVVGPASHSRIARSKRRCGRKSETIAHQWQSLSGHARLKADARDRTRNGLSRLSRFNTL